MKGILILWACMQAKSLWTAKAVSKVADKMLLSSSSESKDKDKKCKKKEKGGII